MQAAHSLANDRSPRMVTSDFVLRERRVAISSLTAAADSSPRSLTRWSGIGSRASFRHRESSLMKGLALYRSRPDKGWSLTDCISFILMKRYALQDALTADHHFVQAKVPDAPALAFVLSDLLVRVREGGTDIRLSAATLTEHVQA